MKKMREEIRLVLMWSFWSVVAFLTVYILIDVDGFLVNHIGLSDADIISPNPASNSVNITLPEGFDDFAELEIFNAIGQKVYATELFSNNTNISVSELHDGLYFVVIKSGTKTQTVKLVIKR